MNNNITENIDTDNITITNENKNMNTNMNTNNIIENIDNIDNDKISIQNENTNMNTNNIINKVKNVLYTEIGVAIVFFIIVLIIFIITCTVKKHPNNSSYMLHTIVQNSTVLYLITQIVAIIIYYRFTDIDQSVLKKASYLIVLIACVVSYLQTIFMGYAMHSQCKHPKRYSIFVNSLIVPIGILLIFYLATTFKFMRIGFYNALNSSDTSYITTMIAISFWIAIIIIPTLTISYFQLEKKACDTNIIEIQKISKK